MTPFGNRFRLRRFPTVAPRGNEIWCSSRRLGSHRTLWACACRANYSTVSGFVYENRSGVVGRQAGDPGVSGVLVSNGRDVVKT